MKGRSARSSGKGWVYGWGGKERHACDQTKAGETSDRPEDGGWGGGKAREGVGGRKASVHLLWLGRGLAAGKIVCLFAFPFPPHFAFASFYRRPAAFFSGSHTHSAGQGQARAPTRRLLLPFPKARKPPRPPRWAEDHGALNEFKIHVKERARETYQNLAASFGNELFMPDPTRVGSHTHT